MMPPKNLLVFFALVILATSPALAGKENTNITSSSQRYTNEQMEHYTHSTWKVMGVPLAFQKSNEDCTGVGKQTFNTVTGRMEICDGTKQYSLKCGTSSACTVEQTGLQNFDTVEEVMQYCNGTQWIYMGSVPGMPCCPEGFIPVLADATTGATQDFCVSKYHMKPIRKNGVPETNGIALGVSSNHYPQSTAEELPWTGFDYASAEALCASMGTSFHLITNAEWMTVAKSIENNTENWSGNAVGTGHIPTGHSDGSLFPGQSYLTASPDDNEGCFGTGNPDCLDKTSNDFWQKRTFVLSNGEIIWDMAGNLNSWVATESSLAMTISTPAPGNIYQLNDVFENDPLLPGPMQVYSTITPLLYPPNPDPSTNQRAFLPANDYGNLWYDQLGFGLIRMDVITNGRIFRGGKFDEPQPLQPGPDPDPWKRHFKINEGERRGGLYSAWIFDPSASWDNLGVRCAYIPTN